MIRNYQGIEYKSLGIDLNNFDKNELIARFKDHQVTGFNVLILIYKGAAEYITKHGVYIPQTVAEKDSEYNSMCGLVLKIGSDAYKGDHFPSGSYCKVGDWVIFPRGSSLQVKYEDEPLIMVEDSKIKLVVPDPSKVSR